MMSCFCDIASAIFQAKSASTMSGQHQAPLLGSKEPACLFGQAQLTSQVGIVLHMESSVRACLILALCWLQSMWIS